VKNLALMFLLMGFMWYLVTEIVLHKLRKDSSVPSTSFTFFLHLSQSFVPLVLFVAAAILYLR
jgi:hypothetical protein